MGKLRVVIWFFWILLLENSVLSDYLGVLVDLGGGAEIRLSLIIKVMMLFMTFTSVLQTQKNKIPKWFWFFSGCLFLSTLSIYFVNRSYFFSALFANLHIQLMLNVAIYILYNGRGISQLKNFYKHLNIFGFINAIFVILSYFTSNLITGLVSGQGSSGIQRSFGLMGDEVSSFLTFFLFTSLVDKKHVNAVVYVVAIICTGGIGAFVLMLALVVYYFIFLRYGRKFIIYIMLVFIPVTLLSWSSLKQVSIFKRINNSIENPKEENGQLRMLSLAIASDMIKERKFFGYGYGAYSANVREKYSPLIKRAGLGYKTDSFMVIMGSTFNPYVQMLCETGIVGLLLYLYFLRRCYVLFKSSSVKQFSCHASWFLIFCLFMISANWFLPSSFNLLLLMSLVGIHLRLKHITNHTKWLRI